MGLWRSLFVLLAGCGLFGVVAYALRVGLRQAWRLAILETFAVLGVLVWVITEALGAFRVITFAGIAVAWALTGTAAAVSAAKLTKRPLRTLISAEFSRVGMAARALPWADRAAMSFMLLSAATLGLIAFAAAPNTWDSMTYHLSRVMHWQQNQSVGFYATSIQRQLSFGPLAEMGMLHYQILAASDRLANFVQFSAMLGSAIGASLIARQLGGGLSAQVFTALATMTIPMGILQATSTQNDYVVTLWCVCFAAFVLEQWESESSRHLVFAAGAALGLALVTKITAVLYLTPIGLWFAIGSFRRNGWGVWRPLFIIMGVAAVTAAPQALRNDSLYGNPVGLTSGPELGKLTNDAYSLPIVASNALRNLGLQLATPWEGANKGLRVVIQAIHDRMGIDVNDPRTTWHDLRFLLVFSMYEDSAGNPLYFLLLCAAALLLVQYRERTAIRYAAVLATSFLVLCLFLKWQPWNSRLLLPLFALAAPLAGVILSRYLTGPKIYVPGLILAAGAIPYLISNPTRPLIGAGSVLIKDRLQQYFSNVPDSFVTYDSAAKILSESACRQIGLASPFDGREYLVWVTNQVYSPAMHLEHVLVRNVSRRFATDFIPCAIVALYPLDSAEMTYQGKDYIRTMHTERFSLFLISKSTP